MRAFLQKWKQALHNRIRYHLRPAGFVFTSAVLLVGLAAILSANNLLFLVWAAMLATLLVSGFVGRLSLSGLALDFVLPEHIAARHQVPARILVRNLKGWMPSFSVRLSGAENSVLSTPLYFPVIPGDSTLEERMEVSFERRGIHTEDSFLFSTAFPFGFLDRRVTVHLQREVLVYPCLDAQPGFEELLAVVAGEMSAHQRGRGYDFYRIRPYEALESARHVDWRATAHTGDLQVREFLREQECPVELYLDLDISPGQEEWFESAVDCCAFLAWRIAQQGARLTFRTQTFWLAIPVEGDIYTILRYLALVAPSTGKSPSSPNDENSYQIAVSAAPERMADLGWADARLLGPHTFPFDPAVPAR